MFLQLEYSFLQFFFIIFTCEKQNFGSIDKQIKHNLVESRLLQKWATRLTRKVIMSKRMWKQHYVLNTQR